MFNGETYVLYIYILYIRLCRVDDDDGDDEGYDAFSTGNDSKKEWTQI